MARYKLRPRQKQRISFRLAVVIGTSVAFVLAGISIVVIQFSDVKESKAFGAEEVYRTAQSGEWTDAGVWEVFDGANWNPADEPPGSEVKSVTVTAGQNMILSEEITLSNLVVEKGAHLDIDANNIKILKQKEKGGIVCYGELNLGDVVIEGDGDFLVGNEAKLYIGSDAGIDKKAASGNIQTKGKREFHKDATYVFNGKIKQHTGNGLPVVLSNLIIDNKSGVELDQNFSITDKLELKNGILKTEKSILTLGVSTSATAQLIQENGAICGRIKFWYGTANFENLKFNISDGFTFQTLVFKSDIQAYKKGLIELIFKPGIPDDAKNSPYEARHVVVAILENGFYSVNLTNGPDEAWMKFISSTKNASSDQITWGISSRILKGNGEILNFSSGEFSNLITGPNPFSNILTVRFYSESTGLVHFSLVNQSGKVMFSEKLDAKSGYNQVNFDAVGNLPSGDYIVQLSNISAIQTIKATKKNSAQI